MKETLPPNASSAAGPPTNHAAGSVGPTPSVPLKRILTDFLEHVADLETRRAADGVTASEQDRATPVEAPAAVALGSRGVKTSSARMPATPELAGNFPEEEEK